MPSSLATTHAPETGAPRVVAVRVPAKINLGLAVGDLRPDRFHELRTVFHAVDLFDTVTATEADSLTLSIVGVEGMGLPADERNLAWRAAALIAEHAGVRPAVRLEIAKQIPVAAGLAGGSADAAATLIACNRLWGLGLDRQLLATLAARLGSDVNFALHGGSAVGTGRGEHLAAVPGAAQFHWVLAVADGGLATPAVYAELDRQRAAGGGSPMDIAGVLAALRDPDAARLAPVLGNDLQPAAIALAPYLSATLAAGLAAGAMAGLVSGSGPTCAFLATDEEHARSLAERVSASGSCRFARPVIGGVPGATVLDTVPNDDAVAADRPDASS